MLGDRRPEGPAPALLLALFVLLAAAFLSFRPFAGLRPALGACISLCLAALVFVLQRDRLRLRQENERLRLLARDAQEIILELDLARGTAEANENFELFMGRRAELAYFLDGASVHPDDQPERLRLEAALRQGGRGVSGELRLLAAGGRWLWFSLLLSAFVEDERVRRVLGKLTCVDEAHRETEALRERASCDSMTGLYNRSAMEGLVAAALSGGPGRHGLLIVDIDDLKQINDGRGHPCGDRAILAMSRALRAAVRKQDAVGRVGGDEFMLLLRGIESEQRLHETVAAIFGRLRGLCGEGAEACPRGSLGAALSLPGESFESLYRRADAALYSAKQSGKNGFAVYGPDMARPPVSVPEA